MLTVRLSELGLRPGAIALDVGCGQGRHTHALAALDGVRVVGVDLSLADVNSAQAGLRLLPNAEALAACGDAFRLPFPNDSFDVVICSEVLEHLHQHQDALTEIARVIKPGGRLAVSVPRDWPERICWRLSAAYPKEPGGHVKIFTGKGLRSDIETAGFAYRRRHYAHGLHSPYWWLKCALWERRDDHPIIRLYQRFLEWDILKRPLLTRALEAIAAPIMGKSIVMYFDRSQFTMEAS